MKIDMQAGVKISENHFIFGNHFTGSFGSNLRLP